MRRIWLPLLLLCVPACLENEEELEIHPDGSVDITLSAQGDIVDLGNGYPLPLDAPWTLASPDARRWARELGRTGGAGLLDRARGLKWPTEPGKDPKAHLVVEGHFRSVEELPRSYATKDEPYASAYLTRDTSLTIERRGKSRVYVFERTYRGFQHARLDPIARAEIPEAIEKKIDERQPLLPSERDDVALRLTSGHERVAEALARAALLGLFTESDELSTDALPGLLSQMRAAALAQAPRKRIDRILDLAYADGDAAGEALESLEEDFRAAMRTTLGQTLERHGVQADHRNAALFALEWQFTAIDNHTDLGDETFTVGVKMPGTIVGGNFAKIEDGRAQWEFDGNSLKEQDVVLRAVSILD